MENGNGLRVVVAEDEPLILNSIKKKIEAANKNFHVVATAEDGQTALESIAVHSPDILFTDIQMPVMDGIGLIKNVSEKYPKIMIVVISGYNNFKYAQMAIKYGVKEYLLKPVKKAELSETLLRLSARVQSEDLSATIKNDRDSVAKSKDIAVFIENYIKENYRSEINFNQIAQKFNFNPSYLSKIFTKYVGENPSKYLISLRINEAKQLLLSNDSLSVKTIGELVGYPDQYHFSHVFKSLCGKSPSEFRDEWITKVAR